ncbi:Phosphoglycerate mutase-like protein 1 [Melia azedarach]|uniref:Phosphoglycerate mutase-like protein 1 n=1 Tax=Melia azedarach TaxID=155640 RepID=A0ACC1WRB6_MELAZ|nr:Phosphoglycerate mutase-like protein 1 [Melia azedarach]
MDAGAAKHLYSLQHCKILHLVRHGQGVHNVQGQNGPEALVSREFFDAQLSPLGWQQVNNLRKQVEASGLTKKVDLVITSPLLRTLQTAVGVFGETQTKGFEVSPSLNANVGKVSHHNSTSGVINCPPIVAVELCRERLGVHPCDQRRSVSEYQSLFPGIDFKLIESEDDNLWKADTREPFEEVVARGMKFLKWLWTRPEKEIAVVSHGIFLQHTLNALLNDCKPALMSELCPRFANCEVRSVVIVDKSATESCYAGSVSVGIQLPRDVTKESISREEVSN